MIKTLTELVETVKAKGTKTRIAVVSAEDSNTLGAVVRAAVEGFILPILLGNPEKIKSLCQVEELPLDESWILPCDNEAEAAAQAVSMIHAGEADVLMKGLIGTDKFLKAVLNKEKGLLPPKAVMSYVCALELPRYHKLLFISDTAVIPFPDLDQKIAMTNYAVKMAL
ncbi:MAG TPA: phosphate acyltransferase, partial [Candidatus Cloacimonadota bacterium]|nr:phosphate acyltransferase [Candidatus Cloacimonadota bacterium]